MPVNYSFELKRHIAQFNKTQSANDFNSLVPALVNARLQFSVGVENLHNSGNADAALMKNAEFYGVFLRTSHGGESYMVAFTDEAEMRKGSVVCTLSLGMTEYCTMFENTDADGIIINPFSKEHTLFLSRAMIMEEMLPAVKAANAKKSYEDGDGDAKAIYNGTYNMQFRTLPSEFFGNPQAFIDNLKNDKEEFLKKHLMVSQLLVCRSQDESEGITDEKFIKERTDRIMIAKGKAYRPDDYFFTTVSEETPKLYILEFPHYMQTPVLCRRMYFIIGENGKAAVYTIEASYNSKQFLCAIDSKLNHRNYGEIASDSAFEETKKVLEMFEQGE